MSKEFKVGLFTFVSGIILYFGINFLKGVDFFSPSSKYYAVYNRIDGLNISNPVIINGYSVGRVNNIKILQKRNNKILVELMVHNDVILGKGTKATLVNSDIMGSKAIVLSTGDIAHPLESGDTLSADIDKGLEAILERAKPLTDNIGVTISRMNEILLEMEGAGLEITETLRTLKKTLVSVDKLVIDTNEGVKVTLNNTNTLLTNVNDKVSKLDPLLANANGILDNVNKLEIEKTVNELNGTLTEINTLVAGLNAGEGSLGKMMKDDSLYTLLNRTLTDLDILLVNFNNNPKHFLGPLGKSSKKIQKDRAKQSTN